jgi:hypothetical protein
MRYLWLTGMTASYSLLPNKPTQQRRHSKSALGESISKLTGMTASYSLLADEPEVWNNDDNRNQL